MSAVGAEGYRTDDFEFRAGQTVHYISEQVPSAPGNEEPGSVVRETKRPEIVQFKPHLLPVNHGDPFFFPLAEVGEFLAARRIPRIRDILIFPARFAAVYKHMTLP